MDNNQTASLGCGTLILIALLIMIFGNLSGPDPDVGQLRNEVKELKALVGQQTEAIKALEKAVRESAPAQTP